MQTRELRSAVIVGGAGFIGSHFTDVLLKRASVQKVTVFDNFSSGREWHISHHRSDSRFQVVQGDVKDLETLKKALAGHQTVIHLASNPDIARAATEPDIDFREGTYLTQNVVEAMRTTGVREILYASGSGVYGDLGEKEAYEDYGPLTPISTYGASKLAGEALIASYCYMFDFYACAFRFANVVGPRQTHGVGFDFVRRLLKEPTHLRILGDGTQSKSYINVFDVVGAVLMAHEKSAPGFTPYNVGTGDYITVKDIADLAVDCVGLNPASVQYEMTGGSRGWKGDVPVVRINSERIQSLGWKCALSSKEALRQAMLSICSDAKDGRMEPVNL